MIEVDQEHARRLVLAFAAALEEEIGGSAAMLTGPMLMLPPERIVGIAQRVDQRYHQIMETVE